MTTSKCPKCGDPHLIRLSSQYKRICSRCDEHLPWELKPNQTPVVSNNRATRNLSSLSR